MGSEMRPPLHYAGRWMADLIIREIEAWCRIMRERPQDCQSGAVPLGSGRWEEGIEPHLALAPVEDKPAWEAALAKAQEYQTLRAALAVCDPTATATIQNTALGPTVVCTCPKTEAPVEEVP